MIKFLMLCCSLAVVFVSQAATVAHWDFEQDLVDADVSSGAAYGHTSGQGVFQAAAQDLSGNGNHLSTWTTGASGVNHSNDVSATNTTGSTRSIASVGANASEGMMTDGGLELNGVAVGALADWTIEVRAKFSSGSMGVYKTVFGIDGAYGALAAVYLQKTNSDQIRVVINDSVGNTSVISPNALAVDTWYHVVVVNNSASNTMDLYINGLKVASTTARTIPAFVDGTSGSNPWAVSVGRGLFNNVNSDQMIGFIDDVRISNVALVESQFLQSFDGDNDGLSDVWELQFDGVTALTDLDGTAPGTGEGAGSGDFDGDGLTDLEEYQAGSKPNDKDTDGDGLEDGVEASGSANPFLNGMLRTPFDSETDPAGDPTSPISDDSDGDGSKDNLEIAFGSDPNDGSSKPASLQEVAVFSFFRGNGQNGVYLAYSRDGLNWSELNGGNVVLTPPAGTLTRDPHITRGKDGKFHMVWTTNWSGTDMGYAFSDDLINWSAPQILDVMGSIPNAENVWAPEMIYDEANDHYTIFWSSRVTGTFGGVGRQYQTTTKDFVTFTQAELFYEPGWDVIDATIIEVGDGTFGMFVKDERNPGKSLHYTTSLNESGPYEIPAGPALFGGAAGGNWAEGPSAIKLGGIWYLYWDYYTEGIYGVATSTDLVNWTEQTSSLTMPSGIRHGTMFTMPTTEFEAIFFPPVPVGEPAVMKHRYNFSGNANDSIGAKDGTLINPTGNSAYSAGQLVLGNTGTQTGASGDHVVLPAGIISNLGNDASVEIWANVTAAGNWQRLFDFGEGSDGSGNNDYYLMSSTHNNGGDIDVGYRKATDNVERHLVGDPPLVASLTAPTHLVVTWDGTNSMVSLYVNGVLVSRDNNPHFDLTDMTDVTNYIGRSRWSADTSFVGSFDELRLWQGVLTTSEVAQHYTNGADATPAPRDHDNDGLPDIDEYVVINNSATDEIETLDDVTDITDFDSDGQSDAFEIRIGTNPADGSSLVQVDPVVKNSVSQDMVISWNTAGFTPGVEFIVHRSVDLVTWTPISGAIQIQGDRTSFTDTESSTLNQNLFYRVEVNP